MYLYFASYSESGAPSFCKFARSIGVTTDRLEAYRRYPEFDRSYRECNEIRRDYLIDSALARRGDPSASGSPWRWWRIHRGATDEIRS